MFAYLTYHAIQKSYIMNRILPGVCACVCVDVSVTSGYLLERYRPREGIRIVLHDDLSKGI